MNKTEKIKLLTDIVMGRLSKKDIIEPIIYFQINGIYYKDEIEVPKIKVKEHDIIFVIQ